MDQRHLCVCERERERVCVCVCAQKIARTQEREEETRAHFTGIKPFCNAVMCRACFDGARAP